MTYYKCLNKDHKGPYSNFDFTPYLPKDGEPGEWLPVVEELSICESGYHYTDREHLIEWLYEEIWEVEIQGETIWDNTKGSAQQIRFLRKIKTWNDKIARLFAVWCAREALKLVKDPDPRSIAACDVAERYANGEATDEELAAAWAAAMDAAWNAAWAAAWAAAMDAARNAAWAAARNAAMDASRAAARNAAMGAQNEKLFEMLGEE